jgi:hypothetical protein
MKTANKMPTTFLVFLNAPARKKNVAKSRPP